MFKSSSFLQSCIFVLVTTNTLHGFPSYSVIQYWNERPILVQTSNFNPYRHLFTTPNQLTPYQNTHVQRIYLNNILHNQINSANDANCAQNSIKVRRYAPGPTDALISDVSNSYIKVPTGSDLKKKAVYCKKNKKKRQARVNNKSTTTIDNGDKKTIGKCKKRNKNTHLHVKKQQCSRNRLINENENDYLIEQSKTEAVKRCRKNRSRNKSQTSPKEVDNSVDREKQAGERHLNIESVNYQNTNKKSLNTVEKGVKRIESEVANPKTCKRVKSEKTKSNNCRKVTEKQESYGCGRIQEQDDYFNINEDCVNHENRCTRNDESIKCFQQYYNLPSDFSDSMAPYMAFNQQLFDTNGFFPSNFDYLYNMQQHPTSNLNGPQKKTKNRRPIRRRNHKHSNKKNCNRNKSDFGKAGGYENNIELAPKLVESTTVSTKIESQIENSFQDIKDSYNESLKLTDNLKENPPNDYYDADCEDCPPIIHETVDDYFPEFHSDNIYTSKEEYDWDNFHDRHYYSSYDMSELDRERRKYDSTDDIVIKQNDKTINYDETLRHLLLITTDTKIINEENIKLTTVYNEEDKDNVKPKKSSEEIQFRTPPALEFPDFKTEMINNKNNTPKVEVYYQPFKEAVNKYKNNKLSAHSNVKNTLSNEKRNKKVDQIDVVTVLGHSKVVKYGAPPNKEDIKSGIINYPDVIIEENKTSDNSNGKTIVVIAKSLPYPL